MAKPLRKSRTLWFNVITTVPLLVEALASQMGLIQPLVPAKWYPAFAAVVGIGNVWLRIITTQAIARSKAADEAQGEK